MRKSPYEKGLYFVDPEPGSTQQSIGSTEWKVGDRYELVQVLGYGSYSCVCLAKDVYDGGRLVALKRIGNVLQSHDQTKRVLREIAVLRRVNHPNVIRLKDVFLQPSSTGQCRLIDTKLVHCSVDLYIATEFAEGGDLYHMKGQLEPGDVVDIMWQLLLGLKYLHSMGIWHRDVKSQNAFIFFDEETGAKVVKLGDFGSSLYYTHGQQRRPCSSSRTTSASTATIEDTMHVDPSPGGGFTAPLTRVIATPCYRAPEVVMSRGGYTDAIDIWGLGCIFGEMLSRIRYVGSAATPRLQVAPMFAVRELPTTPGPGETFGTTSCSMTKKELRVLFDVIGTPTWHDAGQIEMEEWRRYLAKLPGKAPTFQRRFKCAGDVAIHLLTRMLEFDPHRRMTCDEAMMHEYFTSRDDDHVVVVDDDSSLIENASICQHLEEEEQEVKQKKVHEKEQKVKQKVHEEQKEKRNEQEEDPAKALALLEHELEDIMHMEGEDTEDFFSLKTQRLLSMLEAECDAVRHGKIASKNRVGKTSDKGVKSSLGTLYTGGFMEDQRLNLGILDASEYARERMSNVADTWQGRELDPTKFLGAHRHGEWSRDDSRATRTVQGWGVSLPEDPQLREAITKQQGR